MGATAIVSVILPTFNRLRFLRPTIESVYAQTFADWELIIADDGSDLETRQYLQSLAGDARVVVVWLSHTGRPSIVRESGSQYPKPYIPASGGRKSSPAANLIPSSRSDSPCL